MKDLPRQKKLSILDASKFLGVSTKTLRRWEISHILTSERTRGGHRRYNLEQLREFKNKRPEIRNKSLRKQLKAHSVLTPINISQVKSTPIVLDAGPLLNPAQKNVIKFMSFCFFAALTALVLTKTGINSKYINSYKSELVSVLPIPGVAKTVLGTTTAQFEDANGTVVAASNESSKVLAAAIDRTQPLFNVNVQASFREVAEFVKGLNSLDVSTGTLEATGAANLSSTLNVTGNTTVSTLTGTGLATFGNNVSIAGDLTSPSTTFNLLNTGVTTLNIGGASTTTSISATTGTTTVNNNLVVKGAFNSAGKITGSGDLSISGASVLSGALTVSGATALSSTLDVTGNSTFGNITKINGVTYTFPTSQGVASSSLVNDGAGTLTWSTSSSGITGSGTSGQVTFFNGVSSITGDTSFTWNNTTKILSTTGLSLTLGSDATGDTYYRNSSGNFARLGIGTDGQTLSVSSGLPAWTGGAGSGSSGFWTRTGTTLSPFNTGDNIATTGNVGIGSTTAPTHQLDLNATTTTGTIFNLAYGSLTALTGDLTGSLVDLDTGNVTATDQNLTGINVKLPTVTNTITSGTKTLTGFLVNFGTGAGINQTGAGGTTVYNALSATLPALTQTAGTLNVNGLYLTTPSSITTGGTASGINISASGVAAGTLYGLNISSITGSTGTETALNIGSGWDNILSVNSTPIINGSGVTQIAGGGTSFSTYTKGDILYSDATNSLAKLPIGSTSYVLTVSAGGVPSWNTISGSSCSNCLINNPTSDQPISPTGDTTGLSVRQTSTGSPTHDIFSVADSTGVTKYLYVDSNGVVNIPSIGSSASDQLTITPSSDKFALKLVGTNVTSASLQIIQSGNTSGTIFDTSYPSSKSLSGSLIGNNLDLSTNLTVTNQSVTAQKITLPTFTNTNTTGTNAYYGLLIAPPVAGGINQNGSGGTSTYNLVDLTMPALTQTAGTLTSTGVNLTTPSSITTGGTATGINLTASGVGAGTLTGINVGGITAGAGTEVGLAVGSGWDAAATFNGKVGIGSASVPGAYNLSVIPTGSNLTAMFQQPSGNSGVIDIKDSGATTRFEFTLQGGSNNIPTFYDGASGVLKGSISLNNGNVGINTTIPSALFHVNGNNVTTGDVMYASASSITSGNILDLGEGGNTNFTGNGILMDFDNTGQGGIGFTGNFLQLKNAGTTQFQLTSAGNLQSIAGAKWEPLSDSTTALNIANAAGTSFVTFDTTNRKLSITSNSTTNALVVSSTGAAQNVLSIVANSLTTGRAFSASGVNTATTNTAIQADLFSIQNSQATLANTNFTGLGVNFTQTTSIAGNTEYAARIQNQSELVGSTDTNVSGLLLLDNADTTSGSSITVTDALRITNSGAIAAGITNGINLASTTIDTGINFSSTPTTNYISGTNWSITAAGLETLASSLAVNGGSITTTQTTATLFNATVTNLSIGGAATTLNLQGASGLTANIGNANGATALNLTSGTGSQTFTSSVATGTTTSGAFVFNDTALTSGDMIYATASAITSGNLFKLGQGGNTNFTGTGLLMDFDNTGQGGIGFTGNFLQFKNAGTSKFQIDSSGNTLLAASSRLDTIAAGTLNIGTTTANNVTIGNSTTSTALNLTSGTGAQTYTSSVATGTTTSGAFVFKNTALTSGDFIYATASAITSGNIINLGQGGNTNFTGTGLLMDFDNTGQGGIGFTGNFVNFKNATVAKFTVDSTGLITTASVGTGALKTATGSTTLASGDVTMNDYNFFPNVELDTCVGGALAFRNFTTNATNDQIGRFSLSTAAVCSSGTVAVRWRYVTASDHPTIWVKADSFGNVKAVWEAEDPIDPKKYPDNPNPFAGDTLLDGEYFASVQPLTVSQLETVFSTLPSTDQSQIMDSLRHYIVDQRHWLTNLDSISDLNNIVTRFEPSGRQWAMRIIADHYGLANSGFIQYTTIIVNGSLTAKSDFYGAIQGYLAQKQAVQTEQAYKNSLPQNQQNADIAEYYSYDKNNAQPQAGDVVSASSSHLITKSDQPYDSKVMGIVSTSPNETIGNRLQSDDIALALTGRVPVKIDPDSDPISAGDFLTTSGKSGMAMKAKKAGYTVAKALESWDKSSNQTTIMAFVNIGYNMGDLTADGYVSTGQSFIANDIKIGMDASIFGKLFSTTNTATDSATPEATSSSNISLSQTIAALVDRLQKLEADDVVLKNQILLGGTSTPTATDSSQLNNLTVLGKSVLGDTIISGKLNVGGLTVDSTSQSINAIGVLKIQDLALGNVEFMNGLVTIDTNGSMTVKSITSDKYKVAGTSAGSDKIPAGQTSITISSTAVTDKSLIFVTAKDSTQLPLAVTSKTSGTGFKVEIPNSTNKDINFDWWIVDKQ